MPLPEMRILLEITCHLRQGHKVFLLCTPGCPLFKAAEKQGIALIPLKIRHTFDAQALWKIKKIIKDKGIEVLHTHSSVDSWVASMAGKWAGVPVVVRTRHISVPTKTHGLNKIYSLPDAVITTGEHIRRILIKGYGLPEARVYSIPTGVDQGRFYPRPPDEKLKRELGLAQEARVITLVAILRAQKRHELMIAAAPKILERYPQVHFLFVGEGPRRTLIEEEIRRHQLEPFFIMTGHRNDIPEIIALTEIGVITSQAEGVPQFLLQAMAMAKPMVATRVGGIPDIMEDGVNGLLIPPEDPEALVDAVLKLLDDQTSAQHLGLEAKDLIEKKYTAQQMAEQIYQVYLRVFKEKKERRL